MHRWITKSVPYLRRCITIHFSVQLPDYLKKQTPSFGWGWHAASTDTLF